MTFVLTYNGGDFRLAMTADELAPRLPTTLGAFDGVHRRNLTIVRLPEGITGDEQTLLNAAEDTPREFIQAAGTAAQLTVEVCQRTDAGGQLFVIGRRTNDFPQMPPVQIRNGDHTIEVSPAEAFSVAEAARIIASWMEGRSLEEYRLRPFLKVE